MVVWLAGWPAGWLAGWEQRQWQRQRQRQARGSLSSWAEGSPGTGARLWQLQPWPRPGNTGPRLLRALCSPPQALGVEATAVNQAFREQVLAAGGERHSLGAPAPEMHGHAHAGYK